MEQITMSNTEIPNCYRKGTLPHKATHVLVFPLISGPIPKFSCAEHAKEEYWPHSPRPYFGAKLEFVVTRDPEPALDVPEL
jgi:hypothetical protein